MTEKIISNKLGNIHISKEAIATVAGLSAMECYGVVGMASRKVQDGIAELLGWDNLAKGIIVDIKDNLVTINIYVIVGYGIKISEVANNIVERVRFSAKEILDLEKVEIIVYVEGVRVDNLK